MNKLFALACAVLSLALLAPMIGCGGSGSSEYYPAGASLTDEGGARGIRVSWIPPVLNNQYTIVEYQIIRSSPGDAVPTDLVVGIANSSAATFVDTIETRIVTYNNVPGNSGSIGGTSTPASTLIPVSVTATGLTPGRYVYKVRAIYRINENNYYSSASILGPTTPVAFQ